MRVLEEILNKRLLNRSGRLSNMCISTMFYAQISILVSINPSHPSTCVLKAFSAVPESFHTLQWALLDLRHAPSVLLSSPGWLSSLPLSDDMLGCSRRRRRRRTHKLPYGQSWPSEEAQLELVYTLLGRLVMEPLQN